ncbi:Demethyl-4-deoxygadusol synthase [Fusarium oxysporum f. sp. albedinis]|nr:Demethyl-4-deoxygadusol synthase [Fusarium oxysporum f. sp. albedinis]
MTSFLLSYQHERSRVPWENIQPYLKSSCSIPLTLTAKIPILINTYKFMISLTYTAHPSIDPCLGHCLDDLEQDWVVSLYSCGYTVFSPPMPAELFPATNDPHTN